ncbi:TonB-dependent hemoglobin/transferrin/lactoferrin family receptor [Vibrio tubiashii]|uniref:TonB-dependent hemoglobin/transferrin/lactoferrin family receptor n=1 Tax=Vibrio tubiashii TaxID=29498 RepID=A0AAE5GSU3_9VIBR|nr:TonB-dependent hemoglobin/transferrin/lactoferrin family receptor [Vibrio tubiashii]NOI82141.1 TonB-dependent hemoglobin/transferrin/lactoferrin family receptor [Vibrio tubiashii]
MYKKTFLSASIVLALASTAHAEEYALFDEVVVSATRTEQSKADVSSSIETVSSEDIDNTLSTDVKQALKYTPGVNAQGSGRFGISGFNIRGMEQSRIKVMVDDVQQPVPYNSGGGTQAKHQNTFEIDTLHSIEVNKGASSSLYGSDALGGTVLLRTKNPDDILITDGDEHRFGIKTGYTSADETFKTTGTWAMRKDKLETLLMLTYADGNETKKHGDGADIEGDDRGAANPADKKVQNLLAKAYYQLNEQHRLGLTVEHHDFKYEETDLEKLSSTPPYNYSNAFNDDNNKRTRVTLEHEWMLNAAIADQLNWSLSYQDSQSVNDNGDTTDAKGKRVRVRDTQDNSIQFNSQLNKIIENDSSTHEVTYGLSYIKNDFELSNTDYFLDSGTSAPSTKGTSPNATLTQWGAFVQDNVFLMDEKLVVTGGLRFDSFESNPEQTPSYTNTVSKNSDSAITGNIGTVYHLTDKFSTFAKISTGFKAPTVYDLYYLYDEGAIVEPNPDLKAESSISYEVGFRGNNEFGRFELATYFNQYDNFIETVATGSNGSKTIYTNKNLDKVEIYGAELSSTLLMDKAFDLPEGTYTKLSIAYSEGKDKKTGEAINSVAPLTSIVGLGYDNPNQTYGGVMNITMVAAKTDWTSMADRMGNSVENVDVNGYTVVDLTAYYRPMQDLTLRAGLFNALDKKYHLYDDLSGKSSVSNMDYYSQPGRNWGVSLDYQF